MTMSIHDRLCRDISGIGGCDRRIVRRVTSQNSVSASPTSNNGVLVSPRQNVGAALCSCHNTSQVEQTSELYRGQFEMEVPMNRPLSSRLGSMASHPSIVHHASQPSSRLWSRQSSTNHNTLTSPRDMHDIQRIQSQNGTVDIISPRLTRTQRSYINASPPNAREALAMRFIKANMTYSPRPESGNQLIRTYSQPCDGFNLTRNASAPVSALTRTSSIQPQYAARSSGNVARRGAAYSLSQRQISEPIGQQGQGMFEQLSPVQREIEALNRAMREFHENLSISPRVLQDVPETEPLVSHPSEPDSEMHTMYEPCPSPRDHVSHQERMMRSERMQHYDHHVDQIQYVPPSQMYYNVAQEPEPFQEPCITGLPDEFISQFPVTEFDNIAAEKWNEDLKTCAICLELYNRGDRVRRLACTHGYHKVCIDEWLTRSTVCPICKFDYEIMLR